MSTSNFCVLLLIFSAGIPLHCISWSEGYGRSAFWFVHYRNSCH